MPKSYDGYFTSKFKTDEIEAISSDPQRIWIRILNRSLSEEIIIKKNKPFGFSILESKGEVKTKYETVKNTKKTLSKESKKDIKVVFLNRFDFAYAGSDTVNQIDKLQLV